MTRDEIIENNILIAEFMGARTKNHGAFEFRVFNDDWCKEGLKYHYSWNWIMPVLERLCWTKIGDDVTTVKYPTPRTFGMINKENGQIMVRLNGFQCFEAETLIDATYLAIVDILKYLKEHE